jgi:ubiquinone/menaquinone biosynthesis C-methylase UbiE
MYKTILNSDNYIKELEKIDGLSRLKIIQIGYELQSGTYEKAYKKRLLDLMDKRSSILIENIKKILENKERCSIIELGIGEGNTMRHLIEKMDDVLLERVDFFGTDLSFSRLLITNKHIRKCNICLCDMKYLPYPNNKFDIVYTSSSIEPNINEEEKIMKEIYRISRNKIILFEISYKDAGEKLKERYNEHKYVKFLYESIIKLNYNMTEYCELFKNETYNNYLYLIEKKIQIEKDIEELYISPVFEDKLEKINYEGNYFYKSINMGLLFNIINNIPILLLENSIILKENNLNISS